MQNGFDDYGFTSAFEERGFEVVNFDDRCFIDYEVTGLFHKISRKIFRNQAIKNLNINLIKYIKLFKPSIFFVFKGAWIDPDVIEYANRSGCRSILLYPDLAPGIHGTRYLNSIKLFNTFFHTKPNLHNYFVNTIRRDCQFVYPLFDSKHVSLPLPELVESHIGLVANHSPSKQNLVKIVSANSPVPVVVIGHGWPNKALTNVIRKGPLFGPAVREFQRNVIFSLGALTEALPGFVEGDVITSRSIQVPAYGGLLIHQYNKWAHELYNDRRLLFDNIKELIDIIDQCITDKKFRFQLATIQHNAVLSRAKSIQEFVEDITK
jgi:hypothetical protein